MLFNFNFLYICVCIWAGCRHQAAKLQSDLIISYDRSVIHSISFYISFPRYRVGINSCSIALGKAVILSVDSPIFSLQILCDAFAMENKFTHLQLLINGYVCCLCFAMYLDLLPGGVGPSFAWNPTPELGTQMEIKIFSRWTIHFIRFTQSPSLWDLILLE